jgi:hypothetical protein
MAIGSRSSAADSNPTWVHWLVPSVSDLIFVALLGLLTLTALSVRLLGDAGIGWHIRTGQMILATHRIPRVDPFSASMGGQPWFAWEWLYDIKVGWLEGAAGLNGVVVFTALVIALTFSLTFRLLRRGTNVLVALVLVLLAASASMIHFLARPHVVSWLFTVVWFWVLESADGKISTPGDTGEHGGLGVRARLIWLPPVLMLAWVNLHGGFLIGFALLAIYWLAAAWQWLRPTGDRFADILRKIRVGRRVQEMVLTGVLSALATVVNPYGFKLHIHIYRYLSNRFLMDHIDEFQSPNFHYVAQKCFAGLLLLTLVALAVKGREATVSQGLVVLFAIYSGLYASRNIPVSSLLLILVIGPWLSDAMKRYAEKRADRGMASRGVGSADFLQRMGTMESSQRGHLWPIAAILLSCWIAAHGGRLGTKPLMDAHFEGKRFPAAAVSYLETHDAQGPIVSLDSWGGYLIYRLYPQMRMVVDDRHDFYGEEFLKSYLKMVRVEPGWEDFLAQHGARCVIVPKESALANVLRENSRWKAIYGDDVAVVFERGGANGE